MEVPTRAAAPQELERIPLGKLRANIAAAKKVRPDHRFVALVATGSDPHSLPFLFYFNLVSFYLNLPVTVELIDFHSFFLQLRSFAPVHMMHFEVRAPSGWSLLLVCWHHRRVAPHLNTSGSRLGRCLRRQSGGSRRSTTSPSASAGAQPRTTTTSRARC